MRLPKQLVDLRCVAEINLAGRGGRERDITRLLPGWRRASSPLYDYEISHNGTVYRMEVKKQTNLQWFDSGKYYRLDTADRDIRLMFLIHDDGRIRLIAITTIGEFLDWLLQHRESDGWNDEVLRIGADFKVRYPSLQFKARAHIATIIDEAPDLFDILYRQST